MFGAYLQLSTPEASRTPPFGFRVPQQSSSVHTDPWSYGEYLLKETHRFK